MLRAKVVLTALLAAVMGILIILNTRYLNGPGFWAWPWRPIPGTPIYLCMALASIPLFLGLWIDAHKRSLRWLTILLMMLTCFAMKLASVAFRSDITDNAQPNLQLIKIIVENRFATSYYTDALAMSNSPLRTWMILYPELMPGLNLHSRTKPPGPILYWLALIKIMGEGARTALVGGLLLGAIATLSIPAMYLFLRHVLGDDEAALCGAAFGALCPGFVLFFPMMDPTYVMLSTALVGLWFSALRDDRMRHSVLMGIVLAVTCMITFNVLVVGLFMAAMPFVVGNRNLRDRIMIAARQGAVALAAAILLLLIGWIVMGYDPIATFKSAWHNQHALLREYASQRPWPATIPWDLWDFALGTGYISFPLAGFWLFKPVAGKDTKLSLLMIGQLVAVAGLGLLQLETARVWNFMLPLLMIPVGLELSRWPRAARIVPYAALVLLTAAICQNIKWIY